MGALHAQVPLLNQGRLKEVALGFALTLAALGASLLYKGYKGYSWPQFYTAVFNVKAKGA